MNRFATGAAALTMATALFCSVSSRAQTAPTTGPAMQCAALVGLKIPGTTIVIDKATAVPESPPNTVQWMPPAPMTVGVAIPSYCRADGTVDKRVGVGGKPYALGFAIALPDKWNGRFLFQGGGGLNGTINPSLGMTAAGGDPALARGFAVIATDSGHKGAVFDPSFFADQEATLNFANSSVGEIAATGKAIVAAYFGAPATHAYFTGCSTGGVRACWRRNAIPKNSTASSRAIRR